MSSSLSIRKYNSGLSPRSGIEVDTWERAVTDCQTYNAATGMVANCPGRVWTTVAAIFPEGLTRIRPMKSEKSIS